MASGKIANSLCCKHLSIQPVNGYPAGTPVRSFVPEDLKRLADKVEAAGRQLASPRAVGEPRPGDTRQAYGVTLFAGETLSLWEGQGARAIRELTARLDANDVPEASRRVVLYMSFDGEQTVETPISDFFGTGTEDYYGYAWCSDQKFEHAYHNQTRCDGPWNSGDTSVNRFHILDDIPFTKSFRFDLENWPGHEKSKTARSAISYWYARPGGVDFFKSIRPEDTVLIKAPPYRALRVPGAIEGETLKVISTTGVAELQVIGEPEDFSRESHLGWHEGKPGDRLTVALPVATAGRRRVIVGLTKAPDNAKVQLYINGKKAGDVFDLYHEPIAPTGPIDLGLFDLLEGENRLMVEIVGINEAAIKNYMFGLDYILLR